MRHVSKNQQRVFRFIFLLTMFVMSFMQTNAVADATGEAPANMPVKEITIFKDGHAFVLHEGEMPTDTDGNVIIDNLPKPIIGTFWA